MALEADLPEYLHLFSTLRTDRTGGWTGGTNYRAPHKPFLLLVVLDLFAQGRILSNKIELSTDLGELFALYWSKVMPAERRGNLVLPFFHLRTSGFWHLLPQPGQETALTATRQVDRVSQLQKLVSGARLDDELYQLMQVEETRDALRTILIQTYFSPEYHPVLLAQSQVNLQAFLYSQRLIEQARKQLKEVAGDAGPYQPTVRDQGFRRAVVSIYDHRCAFCGVRMLTSDGRTAVDAAHIVPWSITHNDNVHNGMALCRLCHWTFDEGLLGVSAKYLINLSAELRIAQNVPGHLLTLEGRTILGPLEIEFWPHLEALEWHRQKVFRKG